MAEEIEFCAELIHETPDAYLMFDGSEKIWIPKSQIGSFTLIRDDNYELTIPEWLAVEKGII